MTPDYTYHPGACQRRGCCYDQNHRYRETLGTGNFGQC
ncbi:MAG: hypothetical protein EGQ20_03870 [Bacteroides oleiciplenus]|nr:hypothetical protein [Bacteroides oleiciplenus]